MCVPFDMVLLHLVLLIYNAVSVKKLFCKIKC